MTNDTKTTTTTKTLLEDIEISDEMAGMLARMEAQKSDPRAMTAEERAGYVATLCRALRLNPLTRPAQFINLSGKEVLYLTRTATDQLAAMHSLNRKTVDGPRVVDICGTKVGVCTVEVSLPSGRSETATATLPAADFVNLYMKLETKAKRRGTLSILGLGVLGEDEIETIPGAQRSTINETPTTPTQEPPQRPANPLGDLGIEAPASRPQIATETPAPADDAQPVPAWRAALDALAEDVPSLVPYCAAVEALTLPGDAAPVWRSHRAAIGALSKETKGAAWSALVARVESLGQRGAAAWITKGVKTLDAQTDAPAATEAQS